MKTFKVYYKNEFGCEYWRYIKETNKVNAKTKFWLTYGFYPIRVEESQ